MKFNKDNHKETIFEEYNQKKVNFGNGMVELTTYSTPKIKQVVSIEHKGGIGKQSEISDEAQEERTKKQSYSIKRRIRGYALANDFEWFVH